MEIRLLRADEIDLRMQTVKDNGFSLLLYKDARVDMNILDETFGMLGWKRKHEVINDNLFCTISIYNKETGEWIDKQDVGVESNAQKEKGQASDSFKRAAFNVGIGRELYTPIFIWISTTTKATGREKFTVSQIGYNDKREITSLTIVDSKGKQVYKLGSYAKPVENKVTDINVKQGNLSDAQVKRLYAIGDAAGFSNIQINNSIKTDYKKDNASELTKKEYDELCSRLEKAKK